LKIAYEKVKVRAIGSDDTKQLKSWRRLSKTIWSIITIIK
jgi:hypothetical protein